MDRITVLLLATNQLEVYYVRLDEEIQEIDEKIQVAPFHDSFEFIPKSSVKVSELRTLLFRHKPHIVHFSGKGKASGEIVLEDDAGEARPIGVEELIGILRTIKDNIRLVVFNVCRSLAFAQSASAEFDYAIGMDGDIEHKPAVVFAGSFYQALTFGRSVREAFDAAKEQLTTRRLAGAGIPVLLVRPGASDSEPFFIQSEDLEKLKSSLRRLIDGIADEKDRHRIHPRVVGGDVILDEAENTVRGEGEGQTLFDVSVRNGQLHVRLNGSDYQQVKDQLFPPLPGVAPPFPPFVFIGREEALEDVRQLLGNVKRPGDESRESNITVVRGWPGVGKTTLVGVLGRDPTIAKMFPQGVLWTSLEQKPNLLSEMARWGRALGTDEILRAPTLKEATAQLAALLQHRQMLLIIDDVWDAAHAIPFIEALGAQCALLVTTRQPLVAENLTVNEERIYALPVLTETASLKLLRILAPAVVEQHQDECRELVSDLECLPLAIHVAGSLLRSEAKLGWGVTDLIREIREEAKLLPEPSPKDRIEGKKIPTVSALLRKSTDTLDDFVRDCFAFLGAFAPKPATFDLEAMKGVWEVDDPKPVVRKLVGHGLLEPTGSGRFQMHRLLVDHAKSLCSNDLT